MSDFNIQVGATLEQGASSKLQQDLKNMKNLSIEIQSAKLADSAVSGIKNQLESALKGITINFGNIGTQAGQNLGRQINNGLSSQLSNTKVLDQFKKSLTNIGMSSSDIERVASRISNLNVQIESLGQSMSTISGKKGSKNILSVEIGGIDKFGQAVKLTQQWNTDTMQLIKTIDAVSTANQKAGKSASDFINKQKQTVANLRNTLNQISSNALSSNAPKPIKSSANQTAIRTQINEVERAINSLANASSTTFTDARIKVDAEISSLKVLITELQRAESTATAFRAKPIDVIKDEVTQKVRALTADIDKAGVSSEKLGGYITNMNNALGKTNIDASGINDVLNTLAKARAELQALKKEQSTAQSLQKAQIKAQGYISDIKLTQAENSGLSNWKTEINGVETSVASLVKELENVKTSGDVSVAAEKWKSFASAAKEAGVIVSQTTDSISKKLSSIQFKIDSKGYDQEIASIQAKYEKFGVSIEETKEKIESLKQAYNKISNASTSDKRLEAEKEYQLALQKTRNELSILSSKTVSIDKRTNLSNSIQKWLLNNTKATQEARIELQGYIEELKKADLSGTEFDSISTKFKDIDNLMRSQNRLGKSLSDAFSSNIRSFAQWTAASVTFMDAINAVRNAVKNVYEIDTAMTNLYKVTEETDVRYNQFLTSASENAIKLGRNVSSLVEQTANWAKLGYSLSDSEQLAQISSIYANVGEVDDDTAVSDIVTVMKAYDIAAEDAIQIVNKYNKLGNEFATSAKDLGEGLSNAASMLALGGTDINKALALLTGGAEITQSAGELGTALKIGQMRVQGMKGKLEELGETVDENVESISKMQTHILNLTKGEVNIFDDKNNFKDYYDILEEVSKVIDKLSDTERADLLETLFGKNRGNQGAAVLQAFQSGQVQKALEATLNAEGSAMQEQERWMESLEAKTQQFDAAVQTLSNDLLNSNILKWFVDLGTTGVQSIDGLINALTPLGTLFTATSGILGAKGLGLTNCVTYHSLRAYFYKVV